MYHCSFQAVWNFSLFNDDVNIQLCSAPSPGEFHCSFEEEPICMFTQDKNDDFDWTRHRAANRDSKYTPNTGPSADRTGSKQGKWIWNSKRNLNHF